MQVHVELKFSNPYNKSSKMRAKMEELEMRFGELMQEYFGMVESERFNNHEWNLKNNN